MEQSRPALPWQATYAQPVVTTRPECDAKRQRSKDVVAALGKRRKVEDEPSKSMFEWRWGQTPDAHVGEEFWVTGRCRDYNEPYLELSELGLYPVTS